VWGLKDVTCRQLRPRRTRGKKVRFTPLFDETKRTFIHQSIGKERDFENIPPQPWWVERLGEKKEMRKGIARTKGCAARRGFGKGEEI